jgi:hypothetical protein
LIYWPRLDELRNLDQVQLRAIEKPRIQT